MSQLSNLIKDIPGFKLTNSHFKIGSKLHISDFYYAKRFFQNGFFASRMAFLLAQEIIEVIKDKIEEEGRKPDGNFDLFKDGLTIVGYEIYSELLISMICNFLRKEVKLIDTNGNLYHVDINNNLYENVEKPKLCKNNKLYKNIIIIVPIASTFSTSLKIEQQVIKDYQDVAGNNDSPNVISPHFNVIYVADAPDMTISNELSILEEEFKWQSKKHDNREIVVKAYYDKKDKSRIQRYIIALPTNWNDIETCKLCGKYEGREEDALREMPLYETDKTAVTPAIIIDYPKGRDIDAEDLQRRYVIDADTIQYGHYIRHNAHFFYQIDIEKFLNKNEDSVKEWLRNIKNDSDFKDSYKETDRIIILSTCDLSNTSFVTLVNEILFSSSANIIYYDPVYDYLQNLEIVYRQELRNATKIFFVDDSLKSGVSFEKISKFISTSLGSQSQPPKGLSACFFLFNKSQVSTYNNILSELRKTQDNSSNTRIKQVYSYANLHLFISLKPYDKSPLEQEMDRYEDLASQSLIDSLKLHFFSQAKKLEIIKENENNDATHKQRKDDDTAKRNRQHLSMLIASHRIYEYFTKIEKEKLELSSFENFINDILEKTAFPLKNIADEYNDNKAYIKVLTQSPFVQYKPLKDVTFQWCIDFLKNQIEKTKSNMESFDETMLNELKFYMRRTCLLNSNFLLSYEFTEFIVLLYKDKDTGIRRLFNTNNKSKYKAESFYNYYLAQVKELIVRDESRCLLLAKNIAKIKEKYNDSINDYTRIIFNILDEENAVIIKNFYTHVSEYEDWPSVILDDSKHYQLNLNSDTIKTFLEQDSVKSHHKYTLLNSYLKIVEKDTTIVDNKNLLNYLWLEHFLKTERETKDVFNLDNKTATIMSKMLYFFHNCGISKPGAFFIVKDGSRQKPFVAYNRNHMKANEIDVQRDLGGFINNFFNGISNGAKNNSMHTLIDLKRGAEGNWQEVLPSNSKIDIEEGIISKDYNRLLLIRLCQANSFSQDKPQGLIGFYYSAPDDNCCTDTNIIKYLLMLRTPLSKFIERHHENDEFSEWRIANIRQKTSMLTGHGRQMMINLAANNPDNPIYKDIVHSLLTAQRFLIDKKDEQIIHEKATQGDKRIIKLFNDFYKKGTRSIDNAFFDKLAKMAVDIFNSEEIENPEQLNKPDLSEIENNLNFKFDSSLLNMICFELLVNAKKNRWLFNGEPVNTVTKTYSQNEIKMRAKMDGSNLSISIINTCPRISDPDMAKIRNKKNIKKYDQFSGVELIDSILTEFDLGEISFKNKEVLDEKTGLSYFEAILIIKGDEEKNINN